MSQEDDRLAAELASLCVATRDEQRNWSDERVRQRYENLNAQSNAVVFAVWPDKTKPYDIDYEPLKGIELLDRGRTGVGYTIAVVPCNSAEDVIRVRRMFFSS